MSLRLRRRWCVGDRAGEDLLRLAQLLERGVEVRRPGRLRPVVELGPVHVDLEPPTMHRAERDLGFADVSFGELRRQTGGLPEVASGDAVANLKGGLADHSEPPALGGNVHLIASSAERVKGAPPRTKGARHVNPS